jgi:2-phospho-L-lactate guanylyltransferase (CobY/MobA/RfbA family)
MSIWAVIPVKFLYQSKSRLARVLSAGQRAELTGQLLRRTLAVLAQSPAIDQLLVVSNDAAVLEIAAQYSAATLREGPKPGLNSAITQAVQVATAHQATAALILPADLPFIQSEDIAMMVEAAETAAADTSYWGNGYVYAGRPTERPLMVICPDHKDDGTNALLLNLPSSFTFHYGVSSFNRHLQKAEQLGLACQVVHAPGLKFDLDTEEDWLTYQVETVHWNVST